MWFVGYYSQLVTRNENHSLLVSKSLVARYMIQNDSLQKLTCWKAKLTKTILTNSKNHLLSVAKRTLYAFQKSSIIRFKAYLLLFAKITAFKYCCRSTQKSLITCNIWNLFYSSILSRGFGPYKMKRMQSCSFLKNYVTVCLSLVSKP